MQKPFIIIQLRFATTPFYVAAFNILRSGTGFLDLYSLYPTLENGVGIQAQGSISHNRPFGEG